MAKACIAPPILSLSLTKISPTLGTRTRGDMNTGHAPTYENNLKNWKEKINE